MKNLFLTLPPLVFLAAFTAQADPQLTSWYSAQSGKYARIVETDADLLSGTTKTTWTRTTGMFTLTQASPVYAGPQQVDYSSTFVYLRTPSLATYTMGPWYNNAAKTQLFINVPKNQGLIVKIPRTATLAAIPTTKTPTAGYNFGGVIQGGVGYYVDGVGLYDPTDGFGYQNGSEGSPATGSWHRDAYINEGITFDKSYAHQQNTGYYHNHANPIALRYQLGDAVSYNTTTKTYSETLAPTQHSPIIGWMLDGLPIYGPYGYSNALNATSGVRRMIGGFVKRDGTTTGVDNIATAGRTVPAWGTRNGLSQTAGPAVSTTYPLGRYIQDNAYLGDLIKTGTTKYALGTDFDLNEYNVRFCVTPEFPAGTWAYFLNISATGTPQFPFLCNRWFFGKPAGGTVTSVSETVTNQFTGGANFPLTLASTPSVSSSTVTLTWNAVEGGTYAVDASTDNSTWTAKATGLTVTSANTKSNTHNTLSTVGTEYARVRRTALATYDSAGTVAAIVAQTVSTSFTMGTAFANWSATSGLAGDGALPDSDPDGDGVSNTLEYAFGLTPTTADGASRLPQASASGSVLTVTYVRPSSIPSGVTFAVQKLSELGGTWETASTGTDYTENTVANGNGTTTVTISSSTTFNSETKQFLRLAVTVQ